MVTKVNAKVYFSFRKKSYTEEFESVEDAFKFVDDMENGSVGGFATSIWYGDERAFMRNINEEAGQAYWHDLETNDTFVEYRS